MTPERFRQLESLYEPAAALEPAERTRFLEELRRRRGVAPRTDRRV